MKTTVGLSGELALIQQIRRDSERRSGVDRRRGVALGIGDDCAVLRPPAGHEVLVTTDFTLEGRHFRRDWHSPESAGHRTLARGLSDLAAMGAQPLAAFLSLALPKKTPQPWITRYFNGLRELADRWKVPLAGGDTAQAPGAEVLADIVLLGTAPRGTALRRSGARVGDLLYCTGSLGGAAAELLDLQELTGKRKQPPGSGLGINEDVARRKQPAGIGHGIDEVVGRRKKPSGGGRDAQGGHPQLFPEPRLAVGEALRRRGLATACMDLSDGLSSDLRHLCEASKVAAIVELSRLPLHSLAVRRGGTGSEAALALELDLALNGGEDYELLFSARPGTPIPRRIAGVPITCIGRLRKPRGVPQVTQIKPDGTETELRRGGWEHRLS
jgi:thiamine-monophosphate kinase